MFCLPDVFLWRAGDHFLFAFFARGFACDIIFAGDVILKNRKSIGRDSNRKTDLFCYSGNELGRDIRSAGADIQLDAYVKSVLANKIILAWILHYTIEPFQALSPEEILPYIESSPQINAVPLFPSDSKELTALPEKITGCSTEHSLPGEGTVYYDINFRASLPHSPRSSSVNIIIDIEAQKSFYPGYYIESRGVFYCGRLISAQLGREFTGSRYNDIKKVYSIWLCMNAPRYIGNAVSEYMFCKRDLLPGIPDREQAYDKQSLILVCLNEKSACGNQLTDMLNILLSSKIDYKTKMETLKTVYGIPVSRELEEGVENMCNYSEWVLETGRKEGKRLGRREGKKLGREEGKRLGREEGKRLGRLEGFEAVAMRMLKMKKYGDDEILQLSGISRSKLNRLKEKV